MESRSLMKKRLLKLCEGEGGISRNYLLRILLPKWGSASGIRQLLCCVRRFRRLRLYARCCLLAICCLIFLTAYHFCPIQLSLGSALPDTCTAEDCKLVEPLSLAKLSSNLLLVLIHARARGRETRDVIRATWLKGLKNEANSPIQYRFVLGGEKITSAVMDDIMKESLEHGDILIFPTVTDSRYSLTRRTLLSFKYAYESFKFEYALKCDDDSFVDLPRIATELQLRKSSEPFYWGYHRGCGHIYHFGTYVEYNYHICDHYMPFAYGGGYVISKELTKILSTNAEHLTKYGAEDVSVGTWLAPFNVEIKHDARINSQSRGCKDPYLLSHKIDVETMTSYHESMLLEGRMCSWRTHSTSLTGSYLYNWTVPNCLCCRKNSLVP